MEVKQVDEKWLGRTCPCGEPLLAKRKDAKYCSYRCVDAARYYRDREKRLAKNKAYFESHKEDHKIRSAIYRKRHPEKYKARYMVMDAVRRGSLVKLPCKVCGDKKTHGHHEDYSKPLEVIWLCKTHHFEIHRRYGN